MPIYAGILLDTSASMSEGDRLHQAVQGAMGFFDKVITPKDRAAVITFADQPSLAARFTNQQELLAGGLAGVTAAGNTALYDSLIYALDHFGRVKGKKSIILLSDGKRRGEPLQLRRRPSNTPPPQRSCASTRWGSASSVQNADIRLKLSRLADITGGRFFFIEKAKELDGIYDAIQKSCARSTSLAYQSSQEGGAPRQVPRHRGEDRQARHGGEDGAGGYYP